MEEGGCVCVGGGSCKRLMGDGSCPSITREGPADGSGDGE